MQIKTPLHQVLEKTDWKEIFDEHYGKNEVENELPKGKDLQKHFYNNKDWFNHINKKEDVVSKSSVKKDS